MNRLKFGNLVNIKENGEWKLRVVFVFGFFQAALIFETDFFENRFLCGSNTLANIYKE